MPAPGGTPRTDLCWGGVTSHTYRPGVFCRSKAGGFLPGSEATSFSGHKTSEQRGSPWATVWPPIGKAGRL